MALRKPNSGTIILPFRPSTIERHPTRFYSNRVKAYPTTFPGATGSTKNFHNAIDIAAPEGTPIYASEKGVVTAAGTWTDGGKYITVKINPKAKYQSWHCKSIIAKVGQTVPRGLQIATVGMTGYATGPHNHFRLFILEGGRWMEYNAALFFAGGVMADDPRIKPL
jgi:murein DD-endopeptidase MepM/ murein hydrolase activator NlpD